MKNETVLDFQRRTAQEIEEVLNELKRQLQESGEECPRAIASY